MSRTGVWLERATVDDVEALSVLEAASFSHPWTRAQLRDEVAHDGPGEVLVLRCRGARGRPSVAAYCAYRVIVDEMHVMTFAVGVPWRRRGLGTWLLRLCMVRARRAGARRAVLEVRAGNEAARAVYARFGFRELGNRRGYYAEPAEDAIVLTLDPIPVGFP